MITRTMSTPYRRTNESGPWAAWVVAPLEFFLELRSTGAVSLPRLSEICGPASMP